MEKVLLFQVNTDDTDKIRDILGAMKIRVQSVRVEDFRQTLEDLAEGKREESVQPYREQGPEESLILMCGFSEKQMDKFLAALKKKQIRSDYKAVLTPTNQAWNVLRLYAEMAREKAEYIRSGLL